MRSRCKLLFTSTQQEIEVVMWINIMNFTPNVVKWNDTKIHKNCILYHKHSRIHQLSNATLHYLQDKSRGNFIDLILNII